MFAALYVCVYISKITSLSKIIYIFLCSNQYSIFLGIKPVFFSFCLLTSKLSHWYNTVTIWYFSKYEIIQNNNYCVSKISIFDGLDEVVSGIARWKKDKNWSSQGQWMRIMMLNYGPQLLLPQIFDTYIAK